MAEVRVSCITPAPRKGSTETANTTTLMPPIHCVVARQNRMPGAAASIGRSTVADVVVKPDTDSNNALSKRVNVCVARYGIVETRTNATHEPSTVAKIDALGMRSGTQVSFHRITPATPT